MRTKGGTKSSVFSKSAISVSLSLLMSSAAVAESQEMEEVVVTGKSIKASQMAAIDAKRMADNVADVISADAIGRFPDQNLADALGRVPGVAIERDQGQARYIAFRGSPKRYTTTAFNGIDIPGVENGRTPRFDAYPAVITSQVVANKAITADMPGESISGYIDVKTFNPSDIDGWSFSVEVGRGEQDLGGGSVEKQNARLSYSNEDFGFVVYGSDNLREQITDNREMDYVGTEGALTPNFLDYRNYFVDREDQAHGGTVEFYLEDGGRVYLSSLNTKFTDKEERNQWRFYFSDSAAQQDTVESSSVRRYLEDGEYLNETNVNTIGAEFTAIDFDVTVSFSDIETVFDTYLPIPLFLAGSVSNASYDLSNPQSPELTFDGNLQDIFFPVKLLVDAIGGLTTETDQFKLDLETDNSRGAIKFGVKYDSRSATGGGAPLATVAKGFPDVDISSGEGGPWTTSFNNTIGGYYTDNAAIRSAAEAAGATRAGFPEDELITIDETILSAYVMQTFDMDWGNFIVGVRIEDTEYETVGTKLVGAVAEPLTVSRDYTNVLPSAHVNWDLDDDRKLRLSLSSGISRPSYIESRAAADISEVAMAVSGGNPNLEEETSWGIDLAYEWYFAEASIFSATLFHRSIDNVISESSEKVLGSIYSDVAMDGELWDLQGFGNGSDGKLNGLELAFTGRLDNYTEGFMAGFGLEANATFIDSEYKTPGGLTFELPGQSDATYNLSVFYEDHGLSARLSYRYRDAWLDETETSSVFGLAQGIYWDEQSRVDLSVRYDLEPIINQKVSLFLDMNNLTDETDVRYTGALWNPNQVEAYGRRYVAGFRYSL